MLNTWIIGEFDLISTLLIKFFKMQTDTISLQTIHLSIAGCHDLPWWHMMVQSAVSFVFPSQSRPFTGGGFVQVRVRVNIPFPHSLLHSLHLLHEDQPPFSEKMLSLCYITFHNNQSTIPFEQKTHCAIMIFHGINLYCKNI